MAFCTPSPYPDLMVDIETLSTRPNAAILSIAAVPFNQQSGKYSSEHFYQEIDESCYGAEFHIDPKTVAWWEGRAAYRPHGTTPPNIVLEAFSDYLTQLHPTYIWANSPSFDLVILKEAFRVYEIEWPHNFWDERDVRTLRGLSTTPRFQPTHDAVQDCLLQIHLVCSTLNQLSKQ